ncbi:MAG: hypothetical protein ACRCVT_03605 [Leadbetterella sp.]
MFISILIYPIAKLFFGQNNFNFLEAIPGKIPPDKNNNTPLLTSLPQK